MADKCLNNTTIDVLKLLSQGKFYSGNDIAKVLSISRTAVWKHIHTLKSCGYMIDTVQSKGYYLQKPGSPLLSSKIENHLDELDKNQACMINVFPILSSTNDKLKEVILSAKQPVICLAEQQIKGRGRFNRHWVSPFGENIYLSLKVNLEIPFSKMSGFSLCISLALIDALIDFGLSRDLLSVKWPNDLLLEGKKVAGILIELSGEVGSGAEAIIGVGLNVMMQKAKIDKLWTSLSKHFEYPIDRNLLAAHLIRAIMTSINQFESLGFSSFQNKWQKYDALKDKFIELIFYDKLICGQCLGIDSVGNLLIKDKKGHIESYSAGEVSFNKLPST